MEIQAIDIKKLEHARRKRNWKDYQDLVKKFFLAPIETQAAKKNFLNLGESLSRHLREQSGLTKTPSGKFIRRLGEKLENSKDVSLKRMGAQLLKHFQLNEAGIHDEKGIFAQVGEMTPEEVAELLPFPDDWPIGEKEIGKAVDHEPFLQQFAESPVEFIQNHASLLLSLYSEVKEGVYGSEKIYALELFHFFQVFLFCRRQDLGLIILFFICQILPGDEKYLTLFAEQLLKQDYLDACRRVVAKLKKLSPESSRVNQVRGDLHFKNQKFGLANQAYRDAFVLNPENPELYFALARTHFYENRSLEALDWLYYCLSQFPEQFECYRKLALVYRYNHIDDMAQLCREHFEKRSGESLKLPAEILINSLPGGLDISEGGKSIGHTPLLLSHVEEGEYCLVIKDLLGQEFSEKFHILEGMNYEIYFEQAQGIFVQREKKKRKRSVFRDGKLRDSRQFLAPYIQDAIDKITPRPEFLGFLERLQNAESEIHRRQIMIPYPKRKEQTGQSGDGLEPLVILEFLFQDMLQKGAIREDEQALLHEVRGALGISPADYSKCLQKVEKQLKQAKKGPQQEATYLEIYEKCFQTASARGNIHLREFQLLKQLASIFKLLPEETEAIHKKNEHVVFDQRRELRGVVIPNKTLFLAILNRLLPDGLIREEQQGMLKKLRQILDIPPGDYARVLQELSPFFKTHLKDRGRVNQPDFPLGELIQNLVERIGHHPTPGIFLKCIQQLLSELKVKANKANGLTGGKLFDIFGKEAFKRV